MTESKPEETPLEQAVRREVENYLRMCPEGQDAVLSVLRVHLLTEYQMERIFHLILPRGDKVADASLSYAQKISLLEALDTVNDRTVQCLKNLNRVRNRCAHEYEKVITAADVELIGRPLGKEHTEIRRAYEDIGEYLHEVLSRICRDISREVFTLESAQVSGEEDGVTQQEN